MVNSETGISSQRASTNESVLVLVDVLVLRVRCTMYLGSFESVCHYNRYYHYHHYYHYYRNDHYQQSMQFKLERKF